MTIKRRLEKLEAAIPEAAFSVRVLFKRDGEATPPIDPPLRPNEMALVVNFVSGRSLATRPTLGTA